MKTAESVEFPYHLENLTGEPEEKPLPKRLHIIIVQKRIVEMLNAQYPSGGEDLVMPELDVRLTDGRWIVPDVVILINDAQYDAEDMLANPAQALLAIEIQSPRQSLDDLAWKCDRMLAEGCPVCWIILPKSRQAYMKISEGQPVQQFVELRVGDGLVIKIADLFQNLPDAR